MFKSAEISPCGKYRYSLKRVWDDTLPLVAFCMLNPSTADALVDDPTIRRCINYAKAWGYGGIIVVNIFALRSTDPKKLYVEAVYAIQDLELHWINEAYSQCDKFICAWGTHGHLWDRGTRIMEHLSEKFWPKNRMYHLGLTKDAHPRHPLYLKGDLEPMPYVPI